MNNINFKPIFLFIAISFTVPTYAQNWLLGGNVNAGIDGLTNLPTNNQIGSIQNTPISHITNSTVKMWLNNDVNYNVNFQGVAPRNGFLGLGLDFTPTAGVWNNPGPMSLLHLNGDEGTNIGTWGYRNWMRNSILMTNNNDMMYVGPRRRLNNDNTDAVIGWADNNTTTGAGPDNLIFTFTFGQGTAVNDLTGDHPDGREIMRLTTNGNIGMGPRFSNTNQPQSQLIHCYAMQAAR